MIGFPVRSRRVHRLPLFRPLELKDSIRESIIRRYWQFETVPSSLITQENLGGIDVVGPGKRCVVLASSTAVTPSLWPRST